MKEKQMTVLGSGLIWFGAGVSIAEILTGSYFASMGFARGLAAILIGHVIGCLLLYLAGLIGAKNDQSAMETARRSFGQKGALLFSGLNVLQLIGWTAVMIAAGASAAGILFPGSGAWLWCLLISLLIIVWIFIGTVGANKINIVAMSALFLLTLLLSVLIFRSDAIIQSGGEALSFGAGVELAVAMPLSWLPLVSDYTRKSKRPQAVSLTAAIVYFFVSSWMYVIGMGATLLTGESDIAVVMAKLGLGVIGLVIVIFSTVTTTFLDAFSAGVSSASIWPRANEKLFAVLVCVIGLLLAIFTPVSRFEDFLYFIGSVFAPMAAVLIADYFILHREHSGTPFCWKNLVIWLIGFLLYRISLSFSTPFGNTLPVMLIIILLCIAADRLLPEKTAKD